MQSTIRRVDLNNILGILAPGALLLGGLVVVTIGLLEYFHLESYRSTVDIANRNQLLLAVMYLLLSYVLGSSIRLFADDFADRCSRFYLTTIRRSRHPLAGEVFPYPANSVLIAQAIDARIIDFLRRKNVRFDEQGNKGFYNYCKLYIRSHSRTRAYDCEMVESFVRFLSGAFLASLVTFAGCAVLVMLYLLARRPDGVALLALACLITAIIMIAVLERFKYQHSREVMYTWVSYYECVMATRRGRAARRRPKRQRV